MRHLELNKSPWFNQAFKCLLLHIYPQQNHGIPQYRLLPLSSTQYHVKSSFHPHVAVEALPSHWRLPPTVGPSQHPGELCSCFLFFFFLRLSIYLQQYPTIMFICLLFICLISLLLAYWFAQKTWTSQPFVPFPKRKRLLQPGNTLALGTAQGRSRS